VTAPNPKRPATGYEQRKEAERARNAAMSAAGRDIGPIPAVANPERKARALLDFRVFCESYFPNTFSIPWSPDHLKVHARLEGAVVYGGLFAMAMPRGSGKTSMCEAAALWAILRGHPFCALIGPTKPLAQRMLQSIKTEIESNETLAGDFPEVCFPIQALEGITNRCHGQTCGGESTHITWTNNEVVFPTIKGSPLSGAILVVAGITAACRGLKFKRTDGKSVRPTIAIIDDIQTDESAASPGQCATRERMISGAVLGLAGPGKKICGIMPCTVIRTGDVADNLLDRVKHPEWNGERTRLMYAHPADEKKWAKYAELQADSYRAGNRGEEATEYYRSHRSAMDKGAKPAWPERFNPDEISATQHAMNLRIRDPITYASEYDNEPIVLEEHVAELTADQIATKLNHLGRGEVPAGVSYLTAFVDIQEKALFWAVCGWTEEFTGYVLDYGCFPEQHAAYFTLAGLKLTLARELKTNGLEPTIFAGLDKLCGILLGKSWQRDDGAELKIDRCLIDANWGLSTEVVYQFCRQSAHAARVMPSHGKYVGASSLPFDQYSKKKGDRVGHNWRIPSVGGKRAIRHAVFDTNYWKSFIHSRLAVPLGSRGSLSVFGSKPQPHRLLADHLTAEYRVRTEGRGRTVDEWRLKPGRPDNHWLDCAVGCAVAASILGAALGETRAMPGKVKRVSFSEMQRAKKARG